MQVAQRSQPEVAPQTERRGLQERPKVPSTKSPVSHGAPRVSTAGEGRREGRGRREGADDAAVPRPSGAESRAGQAVWPLPSGDHQDPCWDKRH